MLMLAAALFGGPALAAAPEQASPGLQLAALVAQTTDMPAAQVAIAGPQNIYSVEPLGPPAATGEVIARVRTEAVDASWSAEHKIRSWEAHALFDCAGKRVRIIRSASYAEANLKGASKADDLGGSWFAPNPAEPAAVLLAAACDRTFVWPLRAAADKPPATPADAASLKAKGEAVEPAAAPAALAEPMPRAPSPPAGGPRKIAVATSVGAPLATAYEEAASVQKASVTAAAHEPVVAQQPQATSRGGLLKLTAAPTSAVAAVRRWADAGEGFVSRRASTVRRWFAAREPARAGVQQAAL